MKKTKLFFFLLVLACLGAGFFYLSLPDTKVLKNRYPHSIIKSDQRSIEFRRNLPKGWVNFQDIPKHVYGAFVVSEDWTFFDHKGVEWVEVREAIIDDIKSLSFKRGASTITQQVAKNLFLTNEKTLFRKIKELYIAQKLEKTLSKKKILEIYLNIAEMGESIYGLSGAADYYFSKHSEDLNPKEAAFLAMLFPNPKLYSQSFRNRFLTDYARKTIASILKKMVRAKYLNSENLALIMEQPLSFEDI